MKAGIIGTGTVGRTIAAKLAQLDHAVMMGTRNIAEKLAVTEKDNYGNPPFSEWLSKNNNVKLGTFADAASFGDIVFNATNGSSSVTALIMAGTRNLSGKVLVDISNPLDFSNGMPPSLLPGLNNTNSLAEEIQNTFPDAKVVKTLNTMWCRLMIDPGLIGNGNHINFIAGDDSGAKEEVRKILKQFGWKEENIIDLGDITAARSTEAFVTLWIRVRNALNTGAFNFGLVK